MPIRRSRWKRTCSAGTSPSTPSHRLLTANASTRPGGRAHLQARLLHHVSDAFREDPVRILRVARFAARFHDLGFRVAPATLDLMRAMVRGRRSRRARARAGLAGNCVGTGGAASGCLRPGAARLRRARGGLSGSGCAVWRPAAGQVAPGDRHAECTWHWPCGRLRACRSAPRCALPSSCTILARAPRRKPNCRSHVGPRGAQRRTRAARCASAWRYPTAFAISPWPSPAITGLCHRALELRPATLLGLLESLDAFRRGDRVTGFLDACEADARGRTGLEERPYPQRELVLSAWQAALAVDTRAVAGPGGQGDGLNGEALGEAIRQARLAAVTTARERFSPA